MVSRRKGESYEDYRTRDNADMRARRAADLDHYHALANTWRLANRGEVNEKQHAYRFGSHREDVLARQRARYDRAAVRVKKYGLTQEMFDEYLDAQEGCCAFCGTQLPKDIVIDHDHTTGQFRGIVHRTCNVAIAFGEQHLAGYLAASG